MGVNLDNFAFPIDADIESLKARQEQRLGDGVGIYSGQDRGVGFKFYVHAEYNKLKSDLSGTEQWDKIEMIQFFVDKFSKPAERVNDEHRRKFKKEYDAWKAGLEAPGTALSTWAPCEVHQYKTLAGMGIFSVEQLAETPRGKLEGKVSADYLELHNRAIQYVNGQSGRVMASEYADKLAEQARENAKLRSDLDELKNLIHAQASMPESGKKTKAKKIDLDIVSVEA